MTIKFDLKNAKHDDRPYIEGKGWGPGGYICVCKLCGDNYIGEKRSWSCADCAYKDVEGEQYKDWNEMPVVDLVGIRDAAVRWKLARKKICALGMNDPLSKAALNDLSEAEDGLAKLLPVVELSSGSKA